MAEVSEKEMNERFRRVWFDGGWRDRFMEKYIPPRIFSHVKKFYEQTDRTKYLNGINVEKGEGGYYSVPDSLQGRIVGYAVLFWIWERVYPTTWKRTFSVNSMSFQSWVDSFKGIDLQDFARIERRTTYNTDLLLVYGLPTERGTAWEMKELRELIRNRSDLLKSTIWISELPLRTWAEALGDISLASYLTNDCGVILEST